MPLRHMCVYVLTAFCTKDAFAALAISSAASEGGPHVERHVEAAVAHWVLRRILTLEPLRDKGHARAPREGLQLRHRPAPPVDVDMPVGGIRLVSRLGGCVPAKSQQVVGPLGCCNTQAFASPDPVDGKGRGMGLHFDRYSRGEKVTIVDAHANLPRARGRVRRWLYNYLVQLPGTTTWYITPTTWHNYLVLCTRDLVVVSYLVITNGEQAAVAQHAAPLLGTDVARALPLHAAHRIVRGDPRVEGCGVRGEG